MMSTVQQRMKMPFSFVCQALLMTFVNASMNWHEFGGMQYAASVLGKDVYSAETCCQTEDGELATVTNMRIHYFLSSIMSTSKQYWVGVERKGNTFFWQNGSMVDSALWHPLEPSLSSLETAARYEYSTVYERFVLKDLPGSNIKYYLCQRKVNCTSGFHGLVGYSSELNTAVSSSEFDNVNELSAKSVIQCAQQCLFMYTCYIFGYRTDGRCSIYSYALTPPTLANMTGWNLYIMQRTCTV